MRLMLFTLMAIAPAAQAILWHPLPASTPGNPCALWLTEGNPPGRCEGSGFRVQLILGWQTNPGWEGCFGGPPNQVSIAETRWLGGQARGIGFRAYTHGSAGWGSQGLVVEVNGQRVVTIVTGGSQACAELEAHYSVFWPLWPGDQLKIATVSSRGSVYAEVSELRSIP